MLKRLTSEFIIFSLLLTALMLPVAAQSGPTADISLRTYTKQQQAKPETLKETLAKETRKTGSDTSSFDPAKADAIYQKQAQQQPKKWSKTKKVLVISAIAVGVAALLFVLIKYGKDCARTEPANCDWVNDEFCTCVEYEPRNP